MEIPHLWEFLLQKYGKIMEKSWQFEKQLFFTSGVKKQVVRFLKSDEKMVMIRYEMVMIRVSEHLFKIDFEKYLKL
jgi:hypothetical protein